MLEIGSETTYIGLAVVERRNSELLSSAPQKREAKIRMWGLLPKKVYPFTLFYRGKK